MMSPAGAIETASALPAEASASNAGTRSWWRVADFGILAGWVAIVGFTLQHHEKWADEAQAWLIARDLSLRAIWFHELRYEGSPGLWHTLLWIAQHVFHLGYGSIGVIGMAGATAGAALLIFKAPFPRYLRWPLAFTYVMVYQYAVIARPYTLLPLLAFAAALLFKDLQHPERMAVILLLLANLSLHGTILAGCLGLVYLLDARKSWHTFDARLRKRYWVCVSAMALTLVFLFLILRPTPDVAEFATKEQAKLFQQPTHSQKLLGGISGAFLDYPIPSFVFLLGAGLWCYTRRRLLVFLLPVGLLTALYSLVHGYAHHHGALFVAAITAIWIAWPDEAELSAFDSRARWCMQGITILLLGLCGMNLWDAAVVVKREYLYPYSGGEDAAKYLKAAGADRAPMFGYLFGVVAVQAYFDHNIFANMPTAYFHQGVPLRGTALEVEELRAVNPEYVVAYSVDPQLMLDTDGPMWRSLGYEMVHFSDGYYLYKQSVYQREGYLIFRRMGANPDAEVGNRAMRQ